jgi:hypothetical protein
MHHGRHYLFILRCPFPVWGYLDSVILCEYKIMGFTLLVVKRAYGHFLQVPSPRDLKNPFHWNSHLEFLWPSSTSYSWMVILLFKDDESYVDSESSYALSRRVAGCPNTKYGVRIPLKAQALPATMDTTLDFLTVNVGRTPCQYNHL